MSPSAAPTPMPVVRYRPAVTLELEGDAVAHELDAESLRRNEVFVFSRRPVPLNGELECTLRGAGRVVRTRAVVTRRNRRIGFVLSFPEPEALDPLL